MDRDEIESKLGEANMFGGNMSNNDFSTITEYVHSGNYILNALISGSLRGGYPNSRTYCLAGEEGSGKTFLALNACKSMQDRGYKPIFFDTEGAVDRDLIETFGIDPEYFRYEPVSKLEKFQQLITIITKTASEAMEKGEDIPRLFLVLDSLAMLASSKEIEDAIEGNEKTDLKKAKTIRAIFRIVTTDLTGLKIPFLFTNHIYDSPDAFAGSNTSGGRGQKYAPSASIHLKKSKLSDRDKKFAGITVTATTSKNRLAVPHEVKFTIRFDKGMNPFVGLEDFVDWESCGIEKGKVLNKKDAKKTKNVKTYVDPDGNEHYLQPNQSSTRYGIAHLNKSVYPKDLYSSEVFTEDVIDRLNEKKIKPEFQYGESVDDKDPEEAIGGTGPSE